MSMVKFYSKVFDSVLFYSSKKKKKTPTKSKKKMAEVSASVCLILAGYGLSHHSSFRTFPLRYIKKASSCPPAVLHGLFNIISIFNSD